MHAVGEPAADRSVASAIFSTIADCSLHRSCHDGIQHRLPGSPIVQLCWRSMIRITNKYLNK